MAKHVLTCDCGRKLAVDTARAGETIVCACGKSLAVPTLRQLRELPLEVVERAVATRAWGAKQGGMAACAIVAILSLIIAAYSRLSQPGLPQFNPQVRTQAVDHGIANLTPVAAWRLWVDNYRPMAVAGLKEFRHPATDMLEKQVAWHQLLQLVMVGIAAVALVIAVVIALTQTGRQGDKETGRA